MVSWEQMTPEERDRFIYLTLSEDALKTIVLLMKRRHGAEVSIETIMRFAFRVAVNRITPKHLKKEPASTVSPPEQHRPEND
jgi:hypothetical protein